MENREHSTVVGVFENGDQLNRAVEDLKRSGFRDVQIGVVMHKGDTLAEGTGSEMSTPSGSAVAGGAVAGGLLGGVLGAAAALLIPGIGPVVAGGVLATALGGAAAGAVAGGLIGALTDMGVSQTDAQYYDREFRAGRHIVTVKAGSRFEEARQILYHYGAYDVHSQGAQAAGSTWTADDRDMDTERAHTTFQNEPQAMSGWDEARSGYRTNWEQSYGAEGGRWEDDEPYYRYGYQVANNDRYRGRSWDEVSPELRRDWERQYPDRPWDRASNRIREVWDDVTNRRWSGPR